MASELIEIGPDGGVSIVDSRGNLQQAARKLTKQVKGFLMRVGACGRYPENPPQVEVPERVLIEACGSIASWSLVEKRLRKSVTPLTRGAYGYYLLSKE